MSTMNAEETKRWKAKNLRYKKPMVKELNLDTIREKLFDIQGGNAKKSVGIRILRMERIPY